MIKEIRRIVGGFATGMTAKRLQRYYLPWQARTVYLLARVDTMRQTMNGLRKDAYWYRKMRDADVSDASRKRKFQGTALDYVRMRAYHHKKAYGDEKQAAHLLRLADETEQTMKRMRAERDHLQGEVKLWHTAWDECTDSLAMGYPQLGGIPHE